MAGELSFKVKSFNITFENKGSVSKLELSVSTTSLLSDICMLFNPWIIEFFASNLPAVF